MATYTDMVDYVLDWSNRDVSVLSYKTIRQCIRYAHDESYRTLRIAPLEVTRRGTVGQENVDAGFLRVNDDLVEFIQLRKVAEEGPRSYSSFDKPYIVAEAHADARSFNGDTVTLYSDYAFYREGTEIHIYPQIQVDEVWEMYYYRRLPEVNERFGLEDLVAAATVENVIKLADFEELYELKTTAERDALFAVDDSIDEEMTLTQLGFTIEYPDGHDSADDILATDTFIGKLKLHWLRDNNEKVILFGALHQAFDYLDEQDQSQKYKQKFEQEIAKLNKEEMDRMNSGGNINVNFYNRLI